MGLFGFLQSIGSLGSMVRNVTDTYRKFKNEPAESDLERFIAMAVIRYAHPSVSDSRAKRSKVLGNMLELVERGEPVGLFGYCVGVAWAEMDVDISDTETLLNILKIIRSTGISHGDAHGQVYQLEDLKRLSKKFDLKL